jgi:site-specific DNA-methyltransferase (adenine-specific)
MINLYNADCIEQMQKMIDEGIQVESVVTDPPYELGFMGKSWDSTGIAFQKETWELCLQLLKPGGHLLAFSGSRTYHRMAVAIEDAGFEIRDQIMWIYGSGFPKSLNIGKAIDKKLGKEREVIGKGKPMSSLGVMHDDDWQSDSEYNETKGNSEYEGWGTALKPAHEPVVMARKPFKGSVADNVLKHRTGAINIDESRISLSENDDSRLGGKGTWKTDKMAKDVYEGGYDGTETGSSELGRFPANLIHDGSDAVKDIFPHTKSGKMKQHIEGGQYNVYGKMYPRDVETYGDEGSAARFFYSAKVSASERNKGLEHLETKQTQGGGGGIGDYKNDVNSASGKYGSEKAPSKNTHPTVKPVDLMKYLCRLVTPKGGTVLDPFMGSGSTGIAAKSLEFNFIGIEREKEYYDIASARVNASSPLDEFFS